MCPPHHTRKMQFVQCVTESWKPSQRACNALLVGACTVVPHRSLQPLMQKWFDVDRSAFLCFLLPKLSNFAETAKEHLRGHPSAYDHQGILVHVIPNMWCQAAVHANGKHDVFWVASIAWKVVVFFLWSRASRVCGERCLLWDGSFVVCSCAASGEPRLACLVLPCLEDCCVLSCIMP